MKNSIKHFFKQFTKRKIRLTQKAYIFLFCLLLSTFFWFLSALSKTYTTTLNSPLEYSTISDNFILTQAPPKQIEIEVRGSGFELLGEQMSLNRKAVKVNLNFSKKTAEENRYFITSDIIRNKVRQSLDPNIELLGFVNDSLFLNTEKRVSKEIKVISQLTLDFEEGFKQRGELVISPKMVKVSGPKGFVDSLQNIMTIPLELNNLKDSVSQLIPLEVPQNINGIVLEPESVKVEMPVEKYTEKQLNLKIVGENTINRKLKLLTFPNEVEVTFLVPLSEYKNLDENLIKAVTVLNEKNMDSKKLHIQLQNVPKYATVIRLNPEQVEFIIKK